MVENPADSFGAVIGRLLVPVLSPAGLGMWQIGVALLSGISAKEVVVSSFAVLFGVSNANSAAGMETIVANVQAAYPGFGPLNAYCLMRGHGGHREKGERILGFYLENDCL